MSRRIEVVHAEGGIPEKLQKVFPSYAALMRKMEIGTTVTVSVTSRAKGFGDMLLGYGEVTRRTQTGYTHPKRLLHEY